MKEAYWFRHDSNARNDWKILALRSVYGLEGYGRFWYLIEMMRESDDNTLPLNKKAFYYSLIADWKCTIQDVEKFINDCINEFELFETDYKCFWSNSLNHRLQVYTEQKVKRQEDGRKGGRPRKDQQEQPQEAPKQEEPEQDKPKQEKPVRAKNATVAQSTEDAQDSDDVVYLTDLLLTEIKKNNPQAKPPSDMKKWRNEIRLLLSDGYDFTQVDSMIRWCQSDDFWRSNILSAKKLREKSSTLILQMQRRKVEKPKTESPSEMYERLLKYVNGEDEVEQERNINVFDVDSVVL